MHGGHSPWPALGLALVLALVLVAMVWLTAGERTTTLLPERLVADLLAPLQNALTRLGVGVENVVRTIVTTRELHDEVARLRQQTALLERLETEVILLRQENRRLEVLLEFGRHEAETVALARVVGRSPDNWFEYLVINKGSSHGVRPGQVAISARGLVGRVATASNLSSSIMLLTDPESGVGAMVRRSGDTGVILGRGGLGYLQLELFARDADIVVGDVVVTSGLGEIFPGGLPIGTVTEIGHGHAGLIRVARVQPSVDFNRLHELLLLSHSDR